jgi:hypothetical protein
MSSQAEVIWGIVGFLLTVMVLSYILGDNPAFRFATYLFIGVTAGYVTLIVINQVIYPQLIMPLFEGQLIALIPLVLCILLLMKVFPPFVRLGSISMAYLVGAGAAIMIGGAVLGTILPQMSGTSALFDLNSPTAVSNGPFYQLLDAILVFVGLASALLFFYFGAKPKPNQNPQRSSFIETMAHIGQIFIGISLGAIFAGVYSSALTALIDRVSSMWNVIHGLFG